MENNEQKSRMKDKIFYIILALLIITSIGLTFYKYVVLKDYQIVAQVSCSPQTEKCFKVICDPATDDTCSAASSTDERTTYYKIISKKASSILLCESTTEKIGCDKELSCFSGEQSCSYTYCDPANLGDGEQCVE